MKVKVAAGEDGKKLSGQAVDRVIHLDHEARGKVTEGSGRKTGPEGRSPSLTASGWMATKPSPLVSTPSSGPRMVRPRWTFRIYRHSMVCSSKQIREVSATVPLTVRIRGSARRPACRAWLSSQEAAGPGPRPARPARPACPAQVTWVVPAAARGAPPPPGAVVEGSVPFAESPALERVGRQVADLQAGELAHEVSE